MRGNEASIIDQVPSVIPFPIPMRGNEAVAKAATFALSTMFPIPMRGNEYVGICKGDPEESSFQSP